MVDEWLRRRIIAARLGISLAEDRTDLAPSGRQAEIELRHDELNQLLDEVVVR
jgi:hypothetical protein